MYGVGFGILNVFAVLGLSVHGSLREIALGESASFHRSVGGMLLPHTGERLLDFLVGDGNLRLIGPQILVALHLNLRQHFEAGLEPQRLSVLHLQVGNARLRYRNQSLLLSFPPKVLRDQSLNHVILKPIAEALLDDRSRHMPRPKPRQPRTLLIALNLQLGLARNLRSRNLDRDLALNVFLICFRLGRVGSLCGAHVLPFTCPLHSAAPSSKRNHPESIRR